MDWYTFTKLPVDRAMRTIVGNARIKPEHTVQPMARTRGVKRYA